MISVMPTSSPSLLEAQPIGMTRPSFALSESRAEGPEIRRMDSTIWVFPENTLSTPETNSLP